MLWLQLSYTQWEWQFSSLLVEDQISDSSFKWVILFNFLNKSICCGDGCLVPIWLHSKSGVLLNLLLQPAIQPAYCSYWAHFFLMAILFLPPLSHWLFLYLFLFYYSNKKLKSRIWTHWSLRIAFFSCKSFSGERER